MAPHQSEPDAKRETRENGMKQANAYALPVLMLKTLLRRKISSVILTAAILIATLASVILCGLRIRQETAITEMIKNTQIRCTVTNAKGSSVDDLNVGSFYVDMLTGLRHSRGCFLDEYVEDVQALAVEKLAQPAGAEIRRIYTQTSDPDLQAINRGTVVFYDDWSDECLMGSAVVCLVTEDLLQETRSDSSGKSYITIARQNGVEITLQVIGTVAGQMSRRVYCPFYTSLHNGESETFQLASCSFTIRSNQILEESKQKLYEYFVHPVSTASNSYMTAGLLVHDEIYLRSLGELQNNLAVLQVILPTLVAITGCVGFLSAYLTNRRRKKEFAVMRCIGIKRSGVFLQIFLEQGFLAVCGCGLGILLGLLLGEAFFPGTFFLIAICLVVDLLGAVVAALQISRVSVMKLMKMEE